MSDTERTTPAPDRAMPELNDQPLEERTVTWNQAQDVTPTVKDPAGWEEEKEYALRKQLGLRPIAYRRKDAHPDSRPCPSWCQVVNEPGGHSIKNHARPLDANHVSHPVETLAGVYRGRDFEGDDGGTVFIGSTVETMLTQRGTDATHVRVSLYVPDEKTARVLTLTLDDAADLIAVMTHLLAQADASDMLNQERFENAQRNAFELGRDHQRHVALDAFAAIGHPAGCECGDELDAVFTDAVR